jgi:hypothetical protein
MVSSLQVSGGCGLVQEVISTPMSNPKGEEGIYEENA